MPMIPQPLVRRNVALAAWLSLAIAGCGGSGPSQITPLPSPSASAPAGLTPAANMTLLARLSLVDLASRPIGEPAVPGRVLSGSGNWGYTSRDGRRFALTGTSVGLSIVEVTNPSQPRNIALIAGPSSPWREVKTYGTYAYVTTEAPDGAGLDIIDLADPDRPRKVRSWNRTFNRAHSLWIDAERALLFANGTRMGATATGMRVLDLSRDAEDPHEVGAFTGYYIHDSYSRGNVLYASAIERGYLALLDVRRPGEIRETTHFHTGGRFTHNAWLTRDGRYVFITDERPGRPVEGWDLVNPLAPVKVSEYIARSGTIPHNVMVDGDRLLIAHYTEGVHLLDVRDPERPALMGSYDTSAVAEGFAGVWGAYVFPGSDVVVASDMEEGLFVIRVPR